MSKTINVTAGLTADEHAALKRFADRNGWSLRKSLAVLLRGCPAFRIELQRRKVMR